jgi:Dyp-type peroxidase family
MSSEFSDFNQVEPVLDMNNIQGNILAGFNKDHQTLLGFLIGDRNKAKEWIKLISNRISTLYEVYYFNKIFKYERSRQKSEPTGPRATWINIAFSYNGMKILLQDIDKIDKDLESAFKLGLHRRSSGLGDPVDTSSLGHPEKWVIGRDEERREHSVPDIFIIVASDSPTDLVKEVDQLIKTAILKNLTIIYNETGHDLSYYSADKKGKEHFGFKDGISQPAIRGRLSDDSKDFLTPRLDITSGNTPYDIEYTSTSRPLVAPGEFVLGYPTQHERYPKMVLPSKVIPELLRNGSYLVFRRLKQDVDGFEYFINQETKRLKSLQEFTDLTSDKLKAILVGRWPSGAPLALSPQEDDLNLATDPSKNNQFKYSDDINGYNTPTFSHIRKVNPRELDGDRSPAQNLKKKILRRGIPFGIPRDVANSNDNNDRGLLFLSYQSSIIEQFEFLTSKWMNNPLLPSNPEIPVNSSEPTIKKEGGGHDLLVGQSNQEGNRIRYGILIKKIADNKIVKEKITTGNNGIFDWVIPTGGGYFFAPSISTLTYIAEN